LQFYHEKDKNHGAEIHLNTLNISKNINSAETILLNKVKDYALAIMFSGKEGIEEYHLVQTRNLSTEW
jgi:hypothetical protein